MSGQKHEHEFVVLALVPWARRCRECRYMQTLWTDGTWRTATPELRRKALFENGDSWAPPTGGLPTGIHRRTSGHRVRRVG